MTRVAPLGVALALLALSPAAPARELATKTIDRTYRCITPRDSEGGRAVVARAEPKSDFNHQSLTLFPVGSLRDQNYPFVEVAGFPGGFGFPGGGLRIDRSRCRAVGHSFTLSRAGLHGVPDERYASRRCAGGSRVLVRVRVTFTHWRGWSRERVDRYGLPHPTAVARGRPVAASLVVRTRGRPVAYALLDGAGRTRLLAPRCRIA